MFAIPVTPTENPRRPWVDANRPRFSERADAVREQVMAGTLTMDAAEVVFAELRAEMEAERARTEPRSLDSEHVGWSVHWGRVLDGLLSVAASTRYHAAGGVERALDPEWRAERAAMLASMLAAVDSGVTRVAKTSGQPVFTTVTPAAKVNPEGVGLSWDPAVARRQMVAAGLAM